MPIYLFYLVPESAVILKNSANRLYQWQRPYLPDDLCFLRSDESPWLVTIAHENDSYLQADEEEMLQLKNEKPNVFSMLIKDEK